MDRQNKKLEKPIRPMTLPSTYISINPRQIRVARRPYEDVWSEDQEVDTQEIPHDACRTLKYTGARREIARAIAAIVREDGTPTGKIPLVDPNATAKISEKDLESVTASRSFHGLAATFSDDMREGGERRVSLVRRWIRYVAVAVFAMVFGFVNGVAWLAYAMNRAPALTALALRHVDGAMPAPVEELALSAATLIPPDPLVNIGSLPPAAQRASSEVPPVEIESSGAEERGSPEDSEPPEIERAALDIDDEVQRSDSPEGLQPLEAALADFEITDEAEAAAQADEVAVGERDEEVERSAGSLTSIAEGLTALPIRFRSGSFSPTDVDDVALRRIVRQIIENRSASYTIIGFASESEAPSQHRRERIASRRASYCMDLIRSYGPSRRRLESRALEPGDMLPEGAGVEGQGVVFIQEQSRTSR
jgi:hypothetical protein